MRSAHAIRNAIAGLALALLAACAAPGADQPAAAPTDGAVADDGPVDGTVEVASVGEAARALIDQERFAFTVVWEDSGFGPEGGTIAAEGWVDLAEETAVYTPLIDPTGSAEVRIIGDGLYMGPSDGSSWQMGTSQPGQPAWIDVMPYSGAPVTILRHLEGLEEMGTQVDVPEQAGRTCREHPAADDAPESSGFVACQEAGVLRWVRYPRSTEGGPMTTSFDDIGGAFEVVRPTEHITELPDAPDDPSAGEEDVVEEEAPQDG